MSIAQIIESESDLQALMPRHANAAFKFIRSDPSLKLQRWAFVRAIVRRPDLATVLFVATSGERTDIWLSVTPDGEGGWSVQPVSKSAPNAPD